MHIANQAPADVARAIASVWVAKGRSAHPRPYNRWEGDEGETWWVISSPEWPAYHRSKIIVSSSSHLTGARGTDRGGLFVGFYVEKGVGRPAATAVHRAAWEMDDTWRWHGVLADLRAGRFRGAVSQAAQRIGGPIQVIVEAQVPVPEGSARRFLDRVEYESHDGAELTLAREPVIETVEKFLNALGGAGTIPDLAAALNEIPRTEWAWVDLYIGCAFERSGRHDESDLLDARQVADRLLEPFAPWLA